MMPGGCSRSAVACSRLCCSCTSTQPSARASGCERVTLDTLPKNVEQIVSSQLSVVSGQPAGATDNGQLTTDKFLLVGGIDFGFRNPFAAVWRVRDPDDVVWLVGEHYARQMPLSFHAQHLPR